MKVAIDAGHGSNTAGKRTPDGYREHYANVRTAYYFSKALERHGIEYLKVGWNDENAYDDPDYALSTRQSTIKANGCEVSVSWHFNACGDGKTYNDGQGVEVLISNSYPADSRRLAECVQKHLIEGTPQKNRGVKTQALAMCNCNKMGTKASILIECGFMTNKRESELMKDDNFRRECAEETAQGFCEYCGIKYIPEGEKPVIEENTKPQPHSYEKYLVRITCDSLNVRAGAGTSYKVNTIVRKNQVFTIVETFKGWGRLKSGAGWINVSEKYVRRV